MVVYDEDSNVVSIRCDIDYDYAENIIVFFKNAVTSMIRDSLNYDAYDKAFECASEFTDWFLARDEQVSLMKYIASQVKTRVNVYSFDIKPVIAAIIADWIDERFADVFDDLERITGAPCRMRNFVNFIR